MTTFGERLRQARIEAGLTQTQLAVKAGLALPTVSRFETGGGDEAKVETVRKLADALGVDPAWLLFGVGEVSKAAA